MLAKLIASRHKPKAQAVLPSSELTSYLDDIKIQSVRFFGGKFGRMVVGRLGITVCMVRFRVINAILERRRDPEDFNQ